MTQHIKTPSGRRRRAVSLTDAQLVELWSAAKAELDWDGAYRDSALEGDGWRFKGAARKWEVLQRGFLRLEAERQRRGV